MRDQLPERDTSKSADAQGLFRKFIVRRTDGSDGPGGKHEGCEYFVLDVTHDRHAKAALAAYAAAVRSTNAVLADDLWMRYALDDSAGPLASRTPTTPAAPSLAPAGVITGGSGPRVTVAGVEVASWVGSRYEPDAKGLAARINLALDAWARAAVAQAAWPALSWPLTTRT